MIPQRFIEEVQARTDIADVIASYIPIKKAGRNFKAACPFHGEKTPSFMISPQKQIFHCFGCGQGGGALQFVMLYEKVGFVEAIEILAKRAGMEVPREHDPQSGVKNRLYEAVAAASDFFHKNLLSERGKGAMQYLQGRGIDIEAIKKFQLGLAPSGDTLIKHLREQKFTLEQLEQASLAIARNGAYRDLFRERLMFPIFDVRSRPVAFGARIMVKDENSPKYINSIEGMLYSKRDHLYGLNFSKDAVTEQDNLIVVEGYLDMLVPFMLGVKNIAASLGTALTSEQIRIVRRYTQNVTLLFDSDKAGQNASLRALDLLLEQDMRVSVVALPQGDDPDTLARKQGKEEFVKLLIQKQSFFDYKLNVLKSSFDIDTIDGRTKISAGMLETIAKLSSEVQRYEYLRKLAESLKIKEEALTVEFRKIINNARPVVPADTVRLMPAKQAPIAVTEKAILKFLLMNEKSSSIVMKNVLPSDFSSPAAAEALSYVYAWVNQGKTLDTAQLLAQAPASCAQLLSTIIMDEDTPLDKELLKSALGKIRKNRAYEEKERLKNEIKAAESKHDALKLKDLLEQYNKLNREVRNA